MWFFYIQNSPFRFSVSLVLITTPLCLNSSEKYPYNSSLRLYKSSKKLGGFFIKKDHKKGMTPFPKGHNTKIKRK
jgi:hypothetical protein